MAGTFHDRDHPPRNRIGDPLPILAIKIADAQSVHEFSPNSIVMAMLQDRFDLGEPCGESFLSGEPAYRLEDEDVVVHLTLDEIRRMVARCLTPDEFFKLRKEFGVFFQIHEDFYDPKTGEALQPKEGLAGDAMKP